MKIFEVIICLLWKRRQKFSRKYLEKYKLLLSNFIELNFHYEINTFNILEWTHYIIYHKIIIEKCSLEKKTFPSQNILFVVGFYCASKIWWIFCHSQIFYMECGNDELKRFKWKWILQCVCAKHQKSVTCGFKESKGEVWAFFLLLLRVSLVHSMSVFNTYTTKPMCNVDSNEIFTRPLIQNQISSQLNFRHSRELPLCLELFYFSI